MWKAGWTVLIVSLFIVLPVTVYWRQRGQTQLKAQSWETRDARISFLQKQAHLHQAQIQEFRGAGRCSRTSDCRTLGLGSPSCKGFRDHLVYSTQDAKMDPLFGAVKKFNATLLELSDLQFAVPSCGSKPLPLSCLDGHCQTAR